MFAQAILPADVQDHLLALILASLVVMGSPGPSTISVTAVGAAYGIRRSLTYACGLIVGTTAVLLAVAVGGVTLLLSFPNAGSVLTGVSAVYIAYLAFKIATAPPMSRDGGRVSAPRFADGVVLAIANPKAYFAIAAVFSAVSIFANAVLLDAALKVVLLAAMIVVIHVAWLGVGSSLARMLQDPVSSRIANVLLALALIVSTAMTLLR